MTCILATTDCSLNESSSPPCISPTHFVPHPSPRSPPCARVRPVPPRPQSRPSLRMQIPLDSAHFVELSEDAPPSLRASSLTLRWEGWQGQETTTTQERMFSRRSEVGGAKEAWTTFAQIFGCEKCTRRRRHRQDAALQAAPLRTCVRRGRRGRWWSRGNCMLRRTESIQCNHMLMPSRVFIEQIIIKPPSSAKIPVYDPKTVGNSLLHLKVALV